MLMFMKSFLNIYIYIYIYIYVCVCREREIEIETNLEIEERETNISGWTHFDSNVSAFWSHFQEMSVNSTNLTYF